LPPALAEAHALDFCTEHEGHDFQPYERFLWDGEVLEWWRAWIGDPSLDVAPFRVFGQDGSGGLAAFWIRDPHAAIDTQPLVFLGSEGELTVIARDLGDYLWLLAGGVGPLEAVDGIDREPVPIPALAAVARRHTGDAHRPVEPLMAAAEAELEALTAVADSATARQ
jgi:hypothetical protein